MSSEASRNTDYRKWSHGFSRVLRELEQELKVAEQASIQGTAKGTRTNDLDEFSAAFTNLFTRSGSRGHLVDHRQPVDEYTGLFEDRCCACDDPILGDGQFFRGKLYCPACFLKADIRTCYACHHPIDGRAIFALGRAWHPEHLTCTRCNSVLSGERFYVKSGLLYCRPHFGQQTAEICHDCREPLFEEFIQWANKFFCPDHFRCEICTKNLKAEYHHLDLRPICPKCNGLLPKDMRNPHRQRSTPTKAPLVLSEGPTIFVLDLSETDSQQSSSCT